MKNLSFLKGLFVGVAIATIGAVAYASSSVSSSQSIAYVVIDKDIFFCMPAKCTRISKED